ncbi:MAG: ChaN family lipoprotein, partial [Deltaproteobacteria bacterium]
QEEKEKLPNVTCRVDRDYMGFIKRAHGAHAHGRLNFTYFCEAQLVWDKVMAINALSYLKTSRKYSMVLLAGTGHAWKKGIPEQISQRSKLPSTVILPQVPGRIEPGAVTEKDMDYIVLDLSE